MADDENKDPKKGMIGKRILMPISMWTEIQGIARESGGDIRDVGPQLLDLGIQAQDANRFKPRFMPLGGEQGEKVAVYAAANRLSEEQAMIRLLDIGIQAKREEIQKASPPKRDGAPIRVESNGQYVGTYWSYSVPSPGDAIAVAGRHLVVNSRAWSAAGDGTLVAYLRCSPYG